MITIIKKMDSYFHQQLNSSRITFKFQSILPPKRYIHNLYLEKSEMVVEMYLYFSLKSEP